MTKKKATIIDGKALADQWLGDIAAQLQALGAPLHLAAVCASDDAGLKKFVKLKQKAAQKIGVEFSAYYPKGQQELREMLNWLAKDKSVHGIFVEMPLPADWDAQEILSRIPLHKDVDLITREGETAFHQDSAVVMPPSVGALARVLDVRSFDVADHSSAVVGQGDLVGKPIAHWLRNKGSDVSIIDIDTKEPEHIAAEADLLVSGAGVPELVNQAWVKEGATVIDYGYARKGDEYVGDVTGSVIKKAGALTPVPGGMGPLVIAATFENLLTLATK